MTLGPKSLAKLEQVHPDLKKLVLRAAEVTLQPFIVGEGLRSLVQQQQNVAKGVSQTLHSRHLTGHAVDLDAWDPETNEISWQMPAYRRIAAAMLQASGELSIPVEWGGNWKTLVDGPHFQLPWAQYPVQASPGQTT